MAACGIEEHQHSDACYETALTCGKTESEGHHHTGDCYGKVLICEKEVHIHSTACYKNHAGSAGTAKAAEESAVAASTSSIGVTADASTGIFDSASADSFSEDPAVPLSENPADPFTGENAGPSISVSGGGFTDASGNSAFTDASGDNAFTDASDHDFTDASAGASGTDSGSVNADDDSRTENKETGLKYGSENAGDGKTETAAAALTELTGTDNDADSYVPQLDPLYFDAVLNDSTGIYRHAVADGETIEDSSAVPAQEWTRIPNNSNSNENTDTVELGKNDLLRVYLAYTIPAGSLNQTNPVARYRLPGNLHLTDSQVKAVNETVNGVASQYVNYDSLEITDPDLYNAYLGVAAVEGTRIPTDAPEEYLAEPGKNGSEAVEYISATVKVENVYDMDGTYGEKGAYLGQDLIVTFTPYSIEKNRHEYDKDGQPTKAGEKIEGWLTIDLSPDQIDWSEPALTTPDQSESVERETDGRTERTADIIFAAEGKDENDNIIHEISTTLKLVEETAAETGSDQGDQLTDGDSSNKDEDLNGDDATDDKSEEETADKDNFDENRSGENDADKSNLDETADSATADLSTEETDLTVIMPAMSFNDMITVSTGKPAGLDENAGGTVANAAEALPEEAEVTVRVEADEGTFPAGTRMVLKAVEDLDTVAETVTQTVDTANTVGSDNSENDQNSENDEKNAPAEANNSNSTDEHKNLKTYGFQAVDITFIDAEGNEIEPAKPVRVALSSSVIEKARKDAETSAVTDPVVVHVDDDGNAEQMELVNPEEIEPAQGKTEEELTEEPSDAETETVPSAVEATQDESFDPVVNESDALNTAVDSKNDDADAVYDVESPAVANPVDSNTDDAETGKLPTGDSTEAGVVFQTDSFSIYAIVYTVELYSNIITDSGETYRIAVTYDETSGIPQDAELRVREIKTGDDGYRDYYAEAVKTVSDSSDKQEEVNSAGSSSIDVDANSVIDHKSSEDSGRNGEAYKKLNEDNIYARFFDIEIWSDGVKVEPAGNVAVSIKLLDMPETDDKNVIKIVHFNNDGTEIIPYTMSADEAHSAEKGLNNKLAKTNINNEMEFDFTTSSFSVYSVVSYTVDFYYAVDGQEYKYSIKGGSAITLSELLPAIDIITDDPETKENEVKVFIENVELITFSDPALINVSKTENDTTVGAIKDILGLECDYSVDLTEEQIKEINKIKVWAGDWALISLRSFDTEEWLTVVLKDGQTFRIRVTDPVSDTLPSNMQTLVTEDTRSDGIKMWLFDYDLDHNLDHKGNTATATTSTYYTDGINAYSDLKFLGWGASNQDEANRDCLNDFTGLDNAGGNNDIRALQGIVKNELVNGYPVLNDNHKTGGVNQSLAYLFDPTAATNDRTVYGGTSKDSGNVTNLFRKVNGYYIYDSDEHYAELQNDGKTFKVYTSTIAQTDNQGNNHNPTRAVGFFPFDKYRDVYYNLKYENDSSKYGNYGTLYVNPDERITGWNGPWALTQSGPSGLNHHLGVAMEMNFEIPEGGMIGNTPIEFKFSGDDDMWVFIDDQLVLDIGGLHQPVDGTINFATGKATIVGKATQAGHSDNTGNAAIVTVEGANDPRGNNFSFYPALNLTGGDGKIHTMKIFYMERGGCDSNCMISFNLPLVVVKKNSQLTKVKEDTSPLPGAEFTVYEDRACTTPLTVAGEPVKAVSGSDGSIVINNIPYKKEELSTKVYYMKETVVPNEYAENTDLYILHYNSTKDSVDIKKLKPDGTEENLPGSQIVNKKMSLVVKKEWMNEDGTEMDPKPNTPVTFNIKRYKTFQPKPDTSNMQPITLRYNKYGSNNSRGAAQCQVNARPGDIVTVTISDTDTNWSSTSNSYGSEPPEVRFDVVGGSATFDIQMVAGKNIWQLESHNYYKNARNTASISAVNKTYTAEEQEERDPVTVADTGFNQTLTLPTVSGGQWQDTVSNLPAQEIKTDGIHYYYTYYVEEEIPEGYRVIYYDKDGNEIQDPSTLKTDVPGTQQRIGNRKYPHADIPAQKYWGDFEGDEYDWVATLQLDYREIPVPLGDVNPNDCSWADYKPGDSRYCKQISKADPQTTFEELPMYVMKNDGKVYRREYTVIETAYTVWRTHNGARVKLIEYQKEPYIMVPSDAYKYTPWYDHDAGEDDDYDDEVYPGAEDYNIVVHNLRENRNIQKDIDLTVEKEWSNQQYYEDSNAKAKFQLKRYILTEYRNYEETEYANRPKVELHLNDGTRDIEILRVPNGVPMSIHGYLKPGESGTISFSNGISYNADNQTSEPKAFDIPFTADSNSPTITLIGGAQYVVGGASGFRFKELAGSSQTEELDTSFCIEFELDKNNHWRQTFPEPGSSDSGHHDNTTILPAVEVSILDAAENTANTYVYRYFIEEVECTPDSFNATFTNEAGNELLGDISHQVYFDTTIKATNRPTGLDILKVDINHPDRKLPGAIFQLRKLNDGPDGAPPVAAIGGTYPGTVIQPNSDATDTNGKQTFKPDEGLAPGYYEVTEMKAPDGYVLTTESTIYVKVEKLGVIKLLKTDESGAVLWNEAADEGELVGNASISKSVTAADGKTITFTVRNEPGAELPSTGGPGTKLIYILGGMLTAFSLFLLLGRERFRG
ncbi:MAG: fibro-slime domain-containing protein [Lachnospiraceae bacterium]|nr:fibro-slime domain-containing protein [Lachnospiraceae bacterium]